MNVKRPVCLAPASPRSPVAAAFAIVVLASLAAPSVEGRAAAADAPPPSLVILYADDLGYGDLGCYGHPTIRTPALDRMASEGLRFTQFYVSDCVCTPSRSALLTGRLPIRTGMCSDTRRVLFPDSAGGLPEDEITLAEGLKTKGYRTACVGKWHLGHLPKFLPTRNGFDEYFGLPYSNDMHNRQRGDPPVPLMRGEETIEQPAVQETLTRRYADEAVRFIRENRDRPFFLYVPFTFPHVPLFASPEFQGKSRRGLYGDVVEELDHAVGRILDALRESGVAERTLVFFASDNGPWLTQGLNGGSAGLLRDGKGSTWEGGTRVPGIAWWPGTIAPGRTTTAIACTMDLYTTCLTLAGADVPKDRAVDGVDISPILFGRADRGREAVFYYRGTRLMAVRKGPWKAHLMTQPGYGPGTLETHDPPLLFHLDEDPSEAHDVSKANPEVVRDLLDQVAKHRAELKPGPCQLDATIQAGAKAKTQAR